MTSSVSIPPLPKKRSQIRRMIDLWAEGKALQDTVRLGMGHGYLVPSRSDPGGYYVLFYREEDDTWACACRGFRFNKKADSCFHVDDTIEKEKVASRKWKSPSSTQTGRKTSTGTVKTEGGTTKSGSRRVSAARVSRAKAKSTTTRQRSTSSGRS